MKTRGVKLTLNPSFHREVRNSATAEKINILVIRFISDYYITGILHSHLM